MKYLQIWVHSVVLAGYFSESQYCVYDINHVVHEQAKVQLISVKMTQFMGLILNLLKSVGVLLLI